MINGQHRVAARCRATHPIGDVVTRTVANQQIGQVQNVAAGTGNKVGNGVVAGVSMTVIKGVYASAAGQDVVSGATKDRVGTRTADDGIVTAQSVLGHSRVS